MKVLVVAFKDEKIASKIRDIVIRDMSKEREGEICFIKKIEKGEKVKMGLNLLEDDILIIDSDYELKEGVKREIENLLKEYDVIYGIRLYKKRKILRKILSKIYIVFVKFLFPELYFIKDFQAGFKALSKRYRNFIKDRLIIKGFAYDVNLLYYSRFFKVKGYKVLWKEEVSTFLNKFIYNIFKMFLELIYFRFKTLS